MWKSPVANNGHQIPQHSISNNNNGSIVNNNNGSMKPTSSFWGHQAGIVVSGAGNTNAVVTTNSTSGGNSSNNVDSKDSIRKDITEDTYEVGIANDMRELELRLESELEEHDKLWPHPEEITDIYANC